MGCAADKALITLSASSTAYATFNPGRGHYESLKRLSGRLQGGEPVVLETWQLPSGNVL